MSDKKKINIGLDIGVASVGWSIMDDNGSIIDLGVRLFDDAANEKDGKLANEKRRSARHIRRNLTRKKLRKNDFYKLLVKHDFASSVEESKKYVHKIDITKFGVDNPIQLKVKALYEKIPHEQLMYTLFHYLNHRGFFYLTEEDINDNKSLMINQEPTKFPSEIILDFYNINKYYKHSEVTKQQSAQSYEKEIKHIFKTQNINNPVFESEYIALFKRCREFEKGPGGPKQPTKYGMYYYDENGQIVKKEGETLWESTIGKCTYYPDEYRGGKNSPIAEIFNFLNDINNIYFFKNTSYKLDNDIKQVIFEKYNVFGKKNFKLSPKELAKIINSQFNGKFGKDVDENVINGYRIGTKEDKIITEFKNYKIILNWMLENKIIALPINIFDVELLKKANDIFSLLNNTKDLVLRLKKLNNYCQENKISYNEESNENLVNKLKNIMQTHSLSYKAMLHFIDYSLSNLNENINQMQFFIKNKTTSIIKNKYISKDSYNSEVISPTTKRSINQACNIINKMIKVYDNDVYEINNITIEMPRDKNVAEERKKLKKFADENKNKIDEILKLENSSIKSDDLTSIQKLRLKLWDNQSHMDIYSGEHIPFENVITGYDLDIDHIIPYSISADDSQNNKVLTRKHNNAQKLNRTPYLWMNGEKCKFEEFKKRVEQLNISNDKKMNLLSENDPLNNLDQFIGKNLSDTRYASRVILNLLQEHFDNNSYFSNKPKIKVIRGSITNFARYNMFIDNKKVLLPKDRDIYVHHAIDASIVCWLGMNKTISSLLEYNENKVKALNKEEYHIHNNFIINNKTGEIKDKTFNLYDLYKKNEDIINFGKQLQKYNSVFDKENNEIIKGDFANKVKYSRMYETKNNMQLTNETIYSFKLESKDSGHIINKLNLLDKPDKLKEFFENTSKNTKEKLLCFYEDKQLYTHLEKIYNDYKTLKNINPFVEYMKVNFGIENPKWIQINNQKIKFLKYKGNEKTINNIKILKKNEDANSKKMSILESLKYLLIRIYKNNKGKYLTIPINLHVLESNKNSQLIINQQKLDNVLKENNIKNPKYIEINSGTIFIKKDTNDLYYSNGGGNCSNNALDIKPLFADKKYVIKKEINQNEKKDNDKRIRLSVSSLVKDYDIAQVDVLGKIYNRINIADFFEN